ncbi:receptor-type tyrosine-protein phosphatase eta [Megalops cyprinoides]|uniref:receptor-type tyrosine-protein phosphatase eta n=1 Tax=Megalops cyprinoides TaxID=118141 RepID=UPI001864F733|nr:receptor-type tyrosine-protein phosphatase eta [Megalops cyprinoides]
MVNGLTAVAVNTTAMTLTWAKQSDYKGTYSYLVHYGIKAKEKNITTMNETALISDLIQGTNYTFWVTTVANGIQSDQAITSSYTRPDVIRNLSVTKVTTTSVFLDWTEPQGERSYFRVEWESSSMNNTTSTKERSINIAGLTAGTQYTFRVTAVAADNETQGVPLDTSKFTRPDVIRNLSVTNVTTTSVFLDWTEPQGEKVLL